MSDPYPQAVLDALSSNLDELATSLLEVLENTRAGTAPVKLKDNIGRLSRMDELHNQSILKANRTVLENRLKRVRAAQSRFAEGYYGYCLDCDEPIALPRLQAYPDAERCIECQTDAEG